MLFPAPSFLGEEAGEGKAETTRMEGVVSGSELMLHVPLGCHSQSPALRLGSLPQRCPKGVLIMRAQAGPVRHMLPARLSGTAQIWDPTWHHQGSLMCHPGGSGQQENSHPQCTPL